MRKICLILVLGFFLLAGSIPVAANISVTYSDNLKPLNYKDVFKPSNINVPVDDVIQEVYYLQGNLPILKTVNWNIYVTDHNYYYAKNGNNIAGLSDSFRMAAYIFGDAYNIPKRTLGHELGHLARYQFVLRDELIEYYNERIKDSGKPKRRSPYNTPEELFAEDFNWLFGSVHEYWPDYPKPGEKEKAWMLAKFTRGGFTWEQKLEWYQEHVPEGEKEISRAENLYAERIKNGDIKGANSARAWANQIRTVIGLPTVR